MKRLCSVLLILVLFFALGISAMAASSAPSVDTGVTIHEDGSAVVTVAIRLHLESAVQQLEYPVPANAESVLLNGVRAEVRADGDKRQVQLPAQQAGDYSFTVQYTLPDAVRRSGGNVVIALPLLSGFVYAIDTMEFSVTLPGVVAGDYSYLSGYHQADIIDVITTTVSENTLTGRVTEPLKDHETLVLTMTVPASDFPFHVKVEPLVDGWDGAVLILAVLAILYYLLSLMPRFYRKTRCFSPPEGISAGEIGTCLTGAGADLTLMVLTWAQLGYIRIQVSGKKKVTLFKQMEMGNERSGFEVRVFQSLFNRRSTVDGTGLHYAKLYRKVARQSPLLPQLFKKKSGNPLVFRVLVCAAGTLSGVKLGLAMSAQPVVQVLLAILVCLLCGVFSYLIQSGGKCLHLRDKTPLWVAGICSILWIVLGILSGQTAIAVPNVLFQLISGLAIAFGGRRSERGKRCVSNIRGLRHHMTRANTFELQTRLEANPFYFYELAPYALALGVDKRFARRFGKTKLPEAGFLHSTDHRAETASQWAALLRQTADLLNARQKRLPYEQLTGR